MRVELCWACCISDNLKRPTSDTIYRNPNLDAIYEQDDNIVSTDRSVKNTARQTDGKLTQIAASTDWISLQKGGSNFKTHKLIQESHSRLQTKASASYLVLGGLFLAVGLAVGAFAIYNLFTKDFEFGYVLMLLFPLIFGGFGLGMMLYPKPRLFDKHIGWFWTGSPKKNHSADIEPLEKSCRLEQVVALQIIAERITSEDSKDYDSYELNLVLKDGSRLNIMDRGDWESMAADGKVLADFLGVPVLR